MIMNKSIHSNTRSSRRLSYARKTDPRCTTWHSGENMADYTTASESESSCADVECVTFVASCSTAMQKRLSARGLAIPGVEIRKGQTSWSTPFRRNSIQGNTVLSGRTSTIEAEAPSISRPKLTRRASVSGLAETVIQPNRRFETAESPSNSARTPRRVSSGRSSSSHQVSKCSSGTELPRRGLRRASMGSSMSCVGRRMGRRNSISRRMSNEDSNNTANHQITSNHEYHHQPSIDHSDKSSPDFADVDISNDMDFVSFGDSTAFASAVSTDFADFEDNPDYGYGTEGPDESECTYRDSHTGLDLVNTTAFGEDQDSPTDFFGYGYNSGQDRSNGKRSNKNAPPVSLSSSSKGHRTTKVPRRKSLVLR